MLETPHVVVGAAIATKVVNPALALPLSLASHFVLEKVPHWNPHLNTEIEKYGKPTAKSTLFVIIDTLTSLVAGFFIASRVLPNFSHGITILAACFLAALPDIVEGPYYFLGVRNNLIQKWVDFQKSIQEDNPLIPGLSTQLIIIIAAFWWIFN